MGNLNIINRDYTIDESFLIDEPLIDETKPSNISFGEKTGIPFVKFLAAGAVIISSHHAKEVSANNFIIPQKECDIELCVDDYTNSIEADMDEFVTELHSFNAIPNYTKQELYLRVMSFKTLENSWDGYGAYPLEAQSATNALLLLDSIGDKAFGNVDEVYPNTNGTITFTWENDYEEVVNVEIGNNSMSYFVELSGIETTYVNNVEINDKEADKLSHFIQLL